MMDYLRTLDRPALEQLGITSWPYGYADCVRFHELDALNHVNNVVFLTWFETTSWAAEDFFTHYEQGYVTGPLRTRFY